MTTITVSARTHSLVLTKSFAAKAAIFGSDEYKMLQEARRDYPRLQGDCWQDQEQGTEKRLRWPGLRLHGEVHQGSR